MYLSGLRCICGRVHSACLCALGSWSSKRWGGGRCWWKMVEMAKSKFESFKHAMDWTPGFPTKCLEKMSYLGVGVSPGTVPVYHSTNLKLLDKRIKIAELVLRFLVVANGLAAGYSLIQGLRCVVSLVRGSVLFSKPLAWAIFSADQNDPNKTPALSRHKRGCNCKKSFCQKKYCKCFQAGVGCSINCRCDTCKNTFGRKDGVETQPEVEIEACGKEFVENTSRKIEIQNSHGMSSYLSILKLFHTTKRLEAEAEVLILNSSELRKLVPWLPKFQARLLSMLEDYTNARQEKEQEPHKLRKKEKPPLKRLRRSLKLEFDESDDADLFKDESASGHEVK
ncbi:hypothetical protein Ahy_B04g071033 isoform C [Arachis hypogaea]|uniref:CASP-like protein n=1 Tax=Arachis hypogaea TaxID=3818 RepID=A0A444ZJR1_ARAHY|nr:hypothetical protein Ahy_B04g071033 isoform C [Arachis hypogaea]